MENVVGNVGLHLNAKKTEYNQPLSEIKSVNGEKIKYVEDFKYLVHGSTTRKRHLSQDSTGSGSLQQALQNMEI